MSPEVALMRRPSGLRNGPLIGVKPEVTGRRRKLRFWSESQSPGRVSRKREFSWIRLETFGNSRPKKFELRSPETIGDEKSPQFAGLSHPKKEILKKREWMAGDGGIELTHSCSN